MSIGATLAEARQHAGLTVADVSAHTRIREGLIRAIEHDEFDACGGDFYARGHIRAIASAVGADPGSLIGEYDAAHPAGRPVTVEELAERPSRPPRGTGRGRRLLVPVAYVLCLVLIGFAAIWLTSGPGSPRRPAAASSARAASRGPQPGPTPSPASHRPSPTAVPVTTVTPARATAYGPGGPSDGDNPQGAPLALSGNPATPWHTDWYTTARFGNLKSGTGLLLTLDRTVTAISVNIRLGSSPGANLQVRAGPALSGMPVRASMANARGSVRLPLATHPRIRYLLIWFTLLPPDPAGTYQADISSVTVSGTGS